MNKEKINSKRIEPLAAQRNQSEKVIDGKIYCSTPKRSPCAKSLGCIGGALPCDATHCACQSIGGYPGLAVVDGVQLSR